MDFFFPDLNFNSVENLPGFEDCAAFLYKGKTRRVIPVDSATVSRENVDIVPAVMAGPYFIAFVVGLYSLFPKEEAAFFCYGDGRGVAG